jgi:hypothetical protein
VRSVRGRVGEQQAGYGDREQQASANSQETPSERQPTQPAEAGILPPPG